MPADTQRFRRLGESPYPHEEEALQFLESTLPAHDPYRGWALLELPDPSTGRLLEIDALVIGYGAIYLIEIKSHPGRMTGDATDWWWEPPDAPGRRVWVDPPLRLANLKAKILKSRLAPHVQDVPWIQPLVFLSAEDAIADMRADGRLCVVTRGELRDALVKHQFPGSSPTRQNRRLSAPQVQAVVRALVDKVGLRARAGRALAGDYQLGALLGEGPGYQDREAVHHADAKLRARARTYLVPNQTSVERRQQLLRAAARESQLLYEVRDHPNVLSWTGYAPDAPLGPTVLFDAFEGGAPLPAFLRNESPTYEERIELLSQIARALAYCHRREVVHGGLSPEAVLVRRAVTGLESRLTNFQLGQGHDVEGTTHWSQLASAPWFLYQAPELREGNPRDARSDLYSLGSLAHYLFTGRPPADDLAELHKKLVRDHALDPRVVDPAIPDPIANAIDWATQAHIANRPDDAGAWFELLLDELTDPGIAPPRDDTDPLTAKRDDRLGDLVVLGVLGQGASARVLHVSDEDERELALKIALDAEHDERLRAEAAALDRLRHPRVVSLLGQRTLGGRACLLLSLAGSETLKRHLDAEGTVSLDFASRYGDDLLSALEHLEEVELTHRDIKPANLGVGTAGKTAHHLTLFDFSLADVPRTELGVGTSAYRDPFLPARGAWDPAADRWSAAITLHEMLTGVRPSYGSALDPDARLTLAAERFDAVVRGPLVAFFERALHRDVERRFATAKEMRHAWFRAFEAPQPQESEPKKSEPPLASLVSSLVSSEASAIDRIATHVIELEPPDALTDDELRSVSPETPVMALPLSFRARNGLDRAGLLTAKDLLALPENRLSAVRGVGTKVVKEVLDFRERWSALTGASATEGAEPFDPRFAGDDRSLTALDPAALDPRFATALCDAGLTTLGAVARAPRAHVEALAARVPTSVEPLRALLARQTAERATSAPEPIEALLAELLPTSAKGAGPKRAATVRLLYGLAPPFEGRLDVSAREVAAHLEKPAAAVYPAVVALREHWASHPALAELEARAGAVLDRAGGAAPLERAAEALLALLPHDATSPLALARAAALLHIIAEVQKEDLDGVRVRRLGRGRPWLVASEDYVQPLRRLGEAADELASHEVLASPSTIARALESAARGTPLEAASAAQRAEWAAAASERAACSALLEIYPRDLSAERALELSAGLLTASASARHQAGLTPGEVRQKVAARYPDAAPLPERPALDALLARLRLRWVPEAGAPEAGRYLREGDYAAGPTTVDSRTHASIPTPLEPRMRPRLERPELSSAELARLELERRLRIAREQRAFRLLAVNPAYAAEAARALAAHLGVPARPLDALLIGAMKREMAEKSIRPEVVHAADRAGPAGPGWPRLTALMELAEARVQAALLAEPGPLLLTRPGLCARYGLTRLLQALIDRAESDAAEATFLLVPAADRGGVPRIDGVLTVPGVLPTHVLRIPRTFAGASTEAA